MPYISELLHNKISDSSDSVIGKLEDILISPKGGAFSPLEFLVIKTLPDRQIRFVPYNFVENFTSKTISLKNLFSGISMDRLPPGPYIYLKQEVLDRQIVDVAGTRVVRVNDLRIGNFDNKMCVLGIDSSFRGLLRRLGLEETYLARLFKVQLIDWRQAQLLDKGPLQVNAMAENLGNMHPADLANIVEELDIKHGSRLLASLDSSRAAKVLEEVDPEVQTVLVKYLGPERAEKILANMSSDELVDLVKTFSAPEARAILAKAGVRGQALEKLIDYPDNTAGGLMTLDFVNASGDWTVQQTIEEIQRVSDKIRSIVHIYVTDPDGSFKGAVSMRRLILAKKDQLMGQMAKDFPAHSTLKPGDKTQKIIKLMTKYNLYTAAVVDKDKKLVGVVTIDDIMRQLFPTA